MVYCFLGPCGKLPTKSKKIPQIFATISLEELFSMDKKLHKSIFVSVVARSQRVHSKKDDLMKGHMQGLGGMTAVWVIPITALSKTYSILSV